MRACYTLVKRLSFLRVCVARCIHNHMTSPRMWHRITHNMRNSTVYYAQNNSRVYEVMLANEILTFALSVPASLVSGKWWETKDAGNQRTAHQNLHSLAVAETIRDLPLSHENEAKIFLVTITYLRLIVSIEAMTHCRTRIYWAVYACTYTRVEVA